jgi:predicted small metal-binding protein
MSSSNDMYAKKQIMINTIISTLKDNPEFLESALNAVFYGINQAFEKLNQQRASLDAAFLCALGLAKSSRRGSKIDAELANIIIEHLKKSKNRSVLEDEMLNELQEKNIVEVPK